MRYIYISLAFLIVSCQAKFKSPNEHVIKEGAFYFDNIITERDVVYAREDSNQQMLDIYYHGNFVGEPNWIEPDSTLRGLLIWIHGGGWLGGDKLDNIFMFQELLKEGFQVISLNYRMGPSTAPNAAEDVVCALRWIKDNSAKYAIDTDKIFVSGSSAGGHLSLITGLSPTSGKNFSCNVSDISIKGIINFFGITEIKENNAFLSENHPDWNYTAPWIGTGDLESINQNYSPVYLLTAESPEILSVHGVRDEVVPYSQGTLLHKKAEELKIRNRLISIEEGNHGGFGDWGWDLAMEAMIEFMNKD